MTARTWGNSTGVKEAGEGSLAEAREDFFLRDGQNLL